MFGMVAAEDQMLSRARVRAATYIVTALLLDVACVAHAYSAKPATKIKDENEVVHFFSIGDWGSKPYATFFGKVTSGGSMHNTCNMQGDTERCRYKSDKWTREEEAQKRVAEQMKAVVQRKGPIKWVVNVGDNFYFEGVSGSSDAHWKDQFENMYSDPAFHVPFISVLGNHDYGGDCCAKDLFGGALGTTKWFGFQFTGATTVMAQIDYDTEKNWAWGQPKKSRWVMPDFHHTHVIDLGPYKVQIFAIDTNLADIAKQCQRCGGCSNTGNHVEVTKRKCDAGTKEYGGQCICFFNKLFKEQLDFLERELEKSSKDASIIWRFVVAHHPWNFIPDHPQNGLMRFLDLLEKYGVQVFFTGHVHSMRHDIIRDKIHMVMTGSSGGYQYDGGNAPVGDCKICKLGSTIWSSNFMDYGFAHMEMTKAKINVNYINDEGMPLKTVTVEANPSYYYDAQSWGKCSNVCGLGTFHRELKCFRYKANSKVKAEAVEAPLTECDKQSYLEKPSMEGRCFLSEAPKFSYCSDCASADRCQQCVLGFERTENGICMNVREVVIMTYEVAAPPDEEWKLPEGDQAGIISLDEMVLSFLLNQTSLKSSDLLLQTFSIYPKEGTNLKTDPAVVAHHRRLGLLYHSATTVIVPPHEESAREIHAALMAVKDDPSAFTHKFDSTAPDIHAITDIGVHCKGLSRKDSGSCNPPAPTPPVAPPPPGSAQTPTLAPIPPSGPTPTPDVQPNKDTRSSDSQAWPVYLAVGAVIVGAVIVGVVVINRRNQVPPPAIGNQDVQLRNLDT